MSQCPCALWLVDSPLRSTVCVRSPLAVRAIRLAITATILEDRPAAATISTAAATKEIIMIVVVIIIMIIIIIIIIIMRVLRKEFRKKSPKSLKI